jgi:hypothetical protein
MNRGESGQPHPGPDWLSSTPAPGSRAPFVARRQVRVIPVLVIVVAAAVIASVLAIAVTGEDSDWTRPWAVPASEAPAGEAPADGVPGGGVPAESRTSRPPDRDMEAVTVALRALDACRLVDLDVARSHGVVAPIGIPTGPHSCLVTASDYQIVDRGVRIKVGSYFDHVRQYMGAPVRIGGAKAYRFTEATGTGESAMSYCQVAIPVSAVRAVELELGVSGHTDLCPTVFRYAESVVAKLKAPDSVAVNPASRRPYAAWDGCVLLAEALGSDADTFRYKPDGLYDPFAGCRTYESELTEGRSVSGPTLEITYGSALDLQGPTGQIAGKSVRVRESGRECEAEWDNGPSGNTIEWFASTIVVLSAPDCDTLTPLVQHVVAAADGRPPRASVAPQRPLPYAPGETDSTMRGACVHLAAANDDCEPYQEITVPDGRDNIIAAADRNRHTQCAVFKDAIQAEFGPTFTPVAWGEHCIFVEPDHVLSIQVNIFSQRQPNTAPGEYAEDHGDGLYIKQQQRDFGALPGVTFWGARQHTFDIYVSPYGDLTSNGNLHIGLDARGGRGDTDKALDATVDPAHTERAIRVMTTVVNTHFT